MYDLNNSMLRVPHDIHKSFNEFVVPRNSLADFHDFFMYEVYYPYHNEFKIVPIHLDSQVIGWKCTRKTG